MAIVTPFCGRLYTRLLTVKVGDDDDDDELLVDRYRRLELEREDEDERWRFVFRKFEREWFIEGEGKERTRTARHNILLPALYIIYVLA